MVSGTIQEKSGKYYVLLNLYENGKRQVKWISTGLDVKGNKRRAEEMLLRLQQEYEKASQQQQVQNADEPFIDYMYKWLRSIKPTVAVSTYNSYKTMVSSRIDKYFRALGVSLCEVTPQHIQDLYLQILDEGYTPNTAIHYHAVIHRALKAAVKRDLISSNPAERVDKPRKNNFKASYYTKEEVQTLFDVVKGDNLEIPIILAAYYGLRRSEVLGLKWSAIDFEKRTVSINHKVIELEVDGKYIPVGDDTLKTKSSFRTLPLLDSVEKKLLEHKERVDLRKKLFKQSYLAEHADYICVDEMGTLLRPNYVTSHFKYLLEKYSLRSIRFHDLRHTCASLLLANDISMKQIQLWLGHSTFSTTADIYAHLDYSAQLETAQAMEEMYL